MESNHPARTRRAMPVLKTGGATGPLPSPHHAAMPGECYHFATAMQAGVGNEESAGPPRRSQRGRSVRKGI